MFVKFEGLRGKSALDELLHPSTHEWRKADTIVAGDFVRWFVSDSEIKSVSIEATKVILDVVNPDNGKIVRCDYRPDEELSVKVR